MKGRDSHYSVRLARDARDLRAAQRLRYRVFVEELGGDGALVDHENRLERDAFDEIVDHLILVDRRCDPEALEDVVGVYRLLPGARLAPGERFYSESEFDLTALRASGRPLLELGRSCVEADHRGGTAMVHLWNGLAEYVLSRGIEILFGVASFHGTDLAALAQPLSFLHHNHRSPETLRVRAIGPSAVDMAMLPPDKVDRKTAMLGTPALIKGYLRLGGHVGEGAFVDHAFNTTDVCLVMDTARMSERHRDFYTRKAASK
ncbi:MAG: GNAT family N-acetyltransferase [Pseudorhodobacter sp.]